MSIDDVLGPSSPLARRLEGYELREGQLAMARAVERALGNDSHLFVEAGTGTGKTLAYLLPAVLSQRKVVISTATHALQEQIFEKDLPLVREVLAEHGIEFRATLMKGLSNYLCKRRFDERLRSGEPVSAQLAQVERWALETRSGDRAELTMLEENSPAWRDVASSTETRVGAGCKYYDECFVTRMRREADEANIVVVNHHLFFADLALRTGKNAGYGGAIPAYDAVIFDEAHQIESVATDFFGVRISTSRLDALVRDARRAVMAAKLLDSRSMALVDDLEFAGRVFFQAWQKAGAPAAVRRRNGSGGGEESKRLLNATDWTSERRDAVGRLDTVLSAVAAFAEAHERDDAVSVLARRAGDLRVDLARIHATSREEERHWEPDEPLAGALQKATEGFSGGVVWIDARERSVSLGASPVDLGPTLRERLFERVPSVVCTSATLATSTHAGPSFHFAKSRLGALPESEELVVPSPFDFEKRAAFYVAEDLPEPTEAGFEEACANRVAELAAITGGGAFVLCTSNRAMRRIHEELHGRVPGPLYVQGDAPKHVLLERFRASGSATLVATMSFWEGVDVPGRALRLVVIDKIPFAVPSDPVVAARSARIEAEGGNPFTQYSVPSAAITLKQGFGRLIRTKRDSGVVALLDRRAARRGYGRVLLGSLPTARRVRTVEQVRSFWQDLDGEEDELFEPVPEGV
ncbi:DinG family ATP-dependent helicase YoaA [Labilithrix luteola]|uniref:DNA 5'-3' helicase n=1 Tax=Labilithrix luteola TaxID=1391654 RepID=A0A0K1QC09_9BACT|nr:ATP-dependent DNA helicase [Labilithrix luteola]AKV02970.1 DinG family ATP-dependent helicase YoaA [Labilithrix luteola]